REVVELGVGVVAQVTKRGRAIARQYIEGIGELTAAVPARLLRIGGVVLQPVERELEGTIGHDKATLARPREKIAHISVQPDVPPARRPQPERAIRALAREQPIDRLANALVDRGVERKMRFARYLVHVEERHGPAGDLLGAAERIAIERRKQ